MSPPDRDFVTPRDLAENGLNPYMDSPTRIAEVLGIGKQRARALRDLALQSPAPDMGQGDARIPYDGMRAKLAEAFSSELGLTETQAVTAVERLR